MYYNHGEAFILNSFSFHRGEDCQGIITLVIPTNKLSHFQMELTSAQEGTLIYKYPLLPSDSISPTVWVRRVGLNCYWFSLAHVKEYEMKIMGITKSLDWERLPALTWHRYDVRDWLKILV